MSDFLTTLKFEDDGGYPFTLLATLEYYSSLLGTVIRVPAGFQTDLASIPWFAQPLVGFMRVGRFDRAAVIHDWLYATQWLPRGLCDRILRKAMEADRVSWLVRWQIWAGVRVGGWWAWYNDGKHVQHFRNL
jgi:hypothetical protein